MNASLFPFLPENHPALESPRSNAAVHGNNDESVPTVAAVPVRPVLQGWVVDQDDIPLVHGHVPTTQGMFLPNVDVSATGRLPWEVDIKMEKEDILRKNAVPTSAPKVEVAALEDKEGYENWRYQFNAVALMLGAQRVIDLVKMIMYQLQKCLEKSPGETLQHM